MFKTVFKMANGDEYDVKVDTIEQLHEEMYYMQRTEGNISTIEAPAELYLYGASDK